MEQPVIALASVPNDYYILPLQGGGGLIMERQGDHWSFRRGRLNWGELVESGEYTPLYEFTGELPTEEPDKDVVAVKCRNYWILPTSMGNMVLERLPSNKWIYAEGSVNWWWFLSEENYTKVYDLIAD